MQATHICLAAVVRFGSELSGRLETMALAAFCAVFCSICTTAWPAGLSSVMSLLLSLGPARWPARFGLQVDESWDVNLWRSSQECLGFFVEEEGVVEGRLIPRGFFRSFRLFRILRGDRDG